MRMNRSSSNAPAGLMLIELLVTLVIVGVVGAAITGLFLSQSRLFGQQYAMREARTVSQSALNLIFTELRMVDAAAGVEAATETLVTLRVPYALGIVCAGGPAATAVSLFPIDDYASADAEMSGYAWRDPDGLYHYQAASLGAGGASECGAEGINAVPGGRNAVLSPGDPGAYPGAPIFLYRRITYDFRDSPSSPGGVELWRKVEGADTEEEISGPFDGASSGFRFYLLGNEVAQDAAPTDLSQVYGLELVLNGRSGRPAAGGLAPYTAQFATAVFFHNR